MLWLVACSDDAPPGKAAAAIGVPPGDALFANGRDARAFDGFADRFSTIDCRGLAASRAALRAQAEDTGRSSTGTVATAIGTLIGGPAGALASVIGQEATSLVSKSGNLRLAAVEAVAVAKNCDGTQPAPAAPTTEPPGPATPAAFPVREA
ncbi:MAG: hypothetical protein AAFY65_03050 [Pseudomonadota bacterium]